MDLSEYQTLLNGPSIKKPVWYSDDNQVPNQKRPIMGLKLPIPISDT